MKSNPFWLWVLTGLLVVAAAPAFGADGPASTETLTLAGATICERVSGVSPVRPAIVFSIDLGRVSCFTLFDPVPEKGTILHKWYFRDKLVTAKRLTLKPPRWATYTSIQLRQADIGPWRVEIIDPSGRLMKTLRFSITE